MAQLRGLLQRAEAAEAAAAAAAAQLEELKVSAQQGSGAAVEGDSFSVFIQQLNLKADMVITSTRAATSNPQWWPQQHSRNNPTHRLPS